MLPNGFTLFNLFCGIYAIILALHQNLAVAPAFVVLGGIADALDGRVARATGTGSRFGEELDSLVDCISFGLAPALIVYLGRPVGTQGNLDWLLVFIYTACAVMRLARFNVEQAGRKKSHFHGLPSPAAGLTLATYYWFAQTPLYNETVILFTDSTTLAQLPWHNLLRGLMAILAALMISDVPYPAMPSIGFNSIKRILSTLMVIGAFLLVVFRRQEFIFPALLAYVIYGVVNWVIIGFLGRSSTPDEIFWEREAELHQEDELRSAYDRPHIGKEALEDADDAEREDRGSRDGRDGRDGREGRGRERRDAREGREGREGHQRTRTREERKAKRRDEGKRDENKRDEGKRDESRRGESRREGKRDEGSSRTEASHEPKSDSRSEPRERQQGQPKRSDQPRPERPRQTPRAEPASDVVPAVALENQPDDAVVPDEDFDENDSALENETDLSGEDTAGAADGATRARKRRRRRGRGRGSRSRADANGEGNAEGSSDGSAEGSATAAVEGGPASESNNAGGGGDAPPGPSRPESPDPSGTAE